MIYKGYKILGTQQANDFFYLDDNGEETGAVPYGEINYQLLDDPMWYSVVDEDNWVVQTFETIEEAKEYIDEEG